MSHAINIVFSRRSAQLVSSSSRRKVGEAAPAVLAWAAAREEAQDRTQRRRSSESDS